MKPPSKRFLIVLTAWPMLLRCPTFAQTMVPPTPPPSVASTPDMPSEARIGGTGLPLGATEIAPLGVSPLSMGSPGTDTGEGGTSCATPGASPAAANALAAIFDGKGMSPGAAARTSASGQSIRPPRVNTTGMCGSDAGSFASTPAPERGNQAGIPLGATQIGNLGVSPAEAVPSTSVTPVTGVVIETPSTPVVTPAFPLVTIGGISSVPPPPVPGLAPGIASRQHR